MYDNDDEYGDHSMSPSDSARETYFDKINSDDEIEDIGPSIHHLEHHLESSMLSREYDFRLECTVYVLDNGNTYYQSGPNSWSQVKAQ